MTYTFQRRRGIQIFGCVALAALATIFLLQGLFMWPAAGAPVVAWITIGIAVLLYALLIPILRETFTPGPMLVIGPEGLLFRPYSPQTIPWPEISEIKLVRSPRRRRYSSEQAPAYMGVSLDHQSEKENPASMGVVFNVRDPSRYRASGGFANAMTNFGAGMTSGIQITMVRATTLEIITALKTYWRGEIPVVTPSNPLAGMTGIK